jgi:hypothetical protein
MLVETHRNATVEWLTWAVSLEGSGSFGVERPTLHSTFEAAQSHMLQTARELFAQAAVDPDELLADPKPDDWVATVGSSGEAHGFYWDCHHHYVRTRFIVVRPRRAGAY